MTNNLNERFILLNLEQGQYGIAYLFYYCWAKDNLIKADKDIFCWNDLNCLWEKSYRPRIYKLFVDNLIPELEEFRTNKKISKLRDKINGHNCYKAMTFVGDMCIDPTFYQIANKSPHKIATGDNQIINFKTKQVRPRTSKDKWTICSPGILISLDECGDAIKFLDEICCGNKSQREYLQVLMGYFLTGETSERDIFVFHGNGMNGKTVFSLILHHVMKKFYAIGWKNNFLKEKMAVRELNYIIKSRLIRIPEIEISKIKPSFCKHRQTHNLHCKFLMLTNEKPTKEVDHIRFIPFNARFENTYENNKYVGRLYTMINQFFSLAVYGAFEYYENGLPEINF